MGETLRSGKSKSPGAPESQASKNALGKPAEVPKVIVKPTEIKKFDKRPGS